MVEIKKLEKWMEKDGLNPTYLRPFIKSYYEAKNIIIQESIPFLTRAKYKSLLMMCEQFKDFFEYEEFSKLVAKKLVTYSYIHAAYLSSSSKFDELNVKKFATPCKPLPDFLDVSCSINGIVKKSTVPEMPLSIINF